MRTVSTWSLHRTLGRYAAPDSAVLGGPFIQGGAASRGLSLLELPKALQRHGYGAVQICHFHLPSTSPAYLAELRAALGDADVALEALLIDDGDLTDPAQAGLIDAWLDRWMEVALALGARRVRIQVGRAAPSPAVIGEAARRLMRLAEAHPEVRIVIENDRGTLRDAEAVHALLTATGGAVGFLLDTGNWRGPHLEEELARVAPLAETCHAKCQFIDSEPDAGVFLRSLHILKDAGYAGPLALIYDGRDDDEWHKLERVSVMCSEVFGEASALPAVSRE